MRAKIKVVHEVEITLTKDEADQLKMVMGRDEKVAETEEDIRFRARLFQLVNLLDY